MRKFILYIALTILASASAVAQASIQATLDSSQGTVAIPFTLTLNAQVPDGEGLRLLPGNDEDSNKFFILKTQTLDSSTTSGTLNWKAKVWMIGLEEGLREIPPIQMGYAANGSAASIGSNPLQINLKPAVVDTTADIQPIIDPRDAPYTFREFLPYLILILILIGIAFLGYYVWRKRRKQEADAEVLPPEPDPPYVVAFKKLKSIEDRAFWNEGAYKKHYSEVTEALREYVEERLKVPALESTTGETIRSLKRTELDKDFVSKLETILQDADLVKFAKQPADEASSIALLKQAKTWLAEVHIVLDPPSLTPPKS